jgi:hypothetical protein
VRFCNHRLANRACLLVEIALAVTCDPMNGGENPGRVFFLSRRTYPGTKWRSRRTETRHARTSSFVQCSSRAGDYSSCRAIRRHFSGSFLGFDYTLLARVWHLTSMSFSPARALFAKSSSHRCSSGNTSSMCSFSSHLITSSRKARVNSMSSVASCLVAPPARSYSTILRLLRQVSR